MTNANDAFWRQQQNSFFFQCMLAASLALQLTSTYTLLVTCGTMLDASRALRLTSTYTLLVACGTMLVTSRALQLTSTYTLLVTCGTMLVAARWILNGAVKSDIFLLGESEFTK